MDNLCIEERQRLKRLARRSPAEIEQERKNEEARKAWENKPRHEKPLPSAAFVLNAPKFARSADAIAFWSMSEDERRQWEAEAKTPDEAELRKAISAEHRRLSAEGGDPSKLQELLKKKRGRK